MRNSVTLGSLSIRLLTSISIQVSSGAFPAILGLWLETYDDWINGDPALA
ncbi:hypothetical protein [Phyllobacterium phragmitis]|nr:hypothetical protein [Phyllobacterium phragmitis]